MLDQANCLHLIPGSFTAEILNIVQDFSSPATKTSRQLPYINFPNAACHKLKRLIKRQ